MDSSSRLKNLSANAKRASTTIAQFCKQIELSEKDKQILQKAAAILATAGGKAKSASILAAQKETIREAAINAATSEAKKLMSSWPTETILDKLAICIAHRGEKTFCDYLDEEGIDLNWNLRYWFDDAMREIPSSAGWSSVSDKKSIVEIMEHARKQLEIYRQRGSVKLISEQWQARLSEKRSSSPLTDL